MSRPRLLKVMVQPVFVAELDGELVECPADPHVIAAAAWRRLDPGAFADEGAAQLADFLDQDAAPAVESLEPEATPADAR